MGLLERRPRKPEPTRPLTGAGQRVDLNSPKPLAARRLKWQEDAWGYRDSVPELKFACRFITNSLGRLRIYAAQNQPRGEEPIPLSRDGGESGISPATLAAAIEAVERLDLDNRGTNIFSRLGENMEVAAEAYLLGEADPDSPTGESWSVRAVTELRVDGSGRISLVEPGIGHGTAPKVLDPASCELLRIWNPHPQYYDWPDSDLVALLDTCEELRLYDRALRASARSRIGSNSFLFIPDELSLTRAGDAPASAEAPGTPEDADPFFEEIVHAMISPISEEDSPQAVVPMVLRGPAMMHDRPTMELMGSVPIGRAEVEDILGRRAAAASKFGRGINLPPEVVSGLGDVNHWSAWSIDANTCKNHVEPRAEVLCDSLTVAYLWPELLARGCPPAEVRKVCLWYSVDELVQNPNRGQDARDGHAAGVLSDDALVRDLGFSEDDRPGLTERVFRAIEQRALSDQQVPVLLALGGMGPDDPIMQAAVAAAKASVAIKAPQTNGQVGGRPVIDQPARPDAPTPRRAIPRAPAVVSSGAPGRWRVREQMCHELAQIDATLTTQLLAHADATVGAAVEKAGNRIRARAVKNPELAAQFKGRPAALVVAELGRQALDYQDAKDLDEGIDAFEAIWLRTVEDAAHRVAGLNADMLGVAPDPGLVDTLMVGARSAWGWLAKQLRRVIQAVLYGRALPELPGEKTGGPVPASVVRGALALAGGLSPDSPGITDEGTLAAGAAGPLTGLATGNAASSWLTERGAVDLGYEWQYFGLARDSFPAHRALSGRRFTSWTDDVLSVRAGDEWLGISHYHPGDHTGCLCGAFPVLAVPMDPNEGRALADAAQIMESEGQRQSRILLAEADDAAGRTGTVAQQQRDARQELIELRRKHVSERESS